MSDQTCTSAGIQQFEVFEGHIAACLHDPNDASLSIFQRPIDTAANGPRTGPCLISAMVAARIERKALRITDTADGILAPIWKEVKA